MDEKDFIFPFLVRVDLFSSKCFFFFLNSDLFEITKGTSLA